MSPKLLSPTGLMAKAETACTSAQALLQLGDVDGATNRAYYAMFDAARAALLTNQGCIPTTDGVARTHSGVIAAFGNTFVKSGRLPKEIGRLLNRAHEVRLLADYTGSSVDATDARNVVDQAKLFVAAIRAEFVPL